MNEVLKQLISHIELPEDHLKDQDPDIRDIFIEEVEEILELQQQTIPLWLSKPSDKEVLTDIRRSFHTLKGSGRMAGAVESGELAWSIEELLNRVMSGAVGLNEDIQNLVFSVSALYGSLVDDFKQLRPHTIELRTWIVAAQRLRDMQEVEPELRYAIDFYKNKAIPDSLVVASAEKVDLDANVTLFEEEHIATDVIDLKSEKSIENQTLEIFIEESTEHLETISKFLHLEQEPTVEEFNQLIRAVHTIRGSSGMVGFEAVFLASSNVENEFKTLIPENYLEHKAEEQLLSEYYEYVRAYIAALEGSKDTKFLSEITSQFDQVWKNYQANNVREIGEVRSQGIVAQLLELDINDMLDAEFSFVDQAVQSGESYFILLEQQAKLLIEHCNIKQSDELCRIAQYLKRCYEALVSNPFARSDDALIGQIQSLHQYLIDAFDGMASGQNMALTSLIEEEFESAIEAVTNYQAKIESVELSFADSELDNVYSPNSNFDPDLLDIFLEESEELIIGMDQDFSTWENNPQNTTVLNNLFRYLHTLKGGANMIQATHLGDIAHELESIYQRVLSGQLKPNATSMQRIRYAQDEIAVSIQKLRDQNIDEANPQLILELQQVLAGAVVDSSNQLVEPIDTDNLVVSAESNTNTTNDIAYTQDHLESYTFKVNDQLNVQAANHDFDPDLLDIFLDESEELVVGMDQDFNTWEKDLKNTKVLNNLFRYLHTLKGGANMIQATHLGEIAHELESIYERVVKGTFAPNTQALQLIRYAQDDIATRLQKLRDQGVDEHNPSLIAELQSLTGQGSTVSTQNVSVIVEDSTVEIESSDVEVEESAIADEISFEPTAEDTQDLVQEESEVVSEEQKTTAKHTSPEPELVKAKVRDSSVQPAFLTQAIASGDESQVVIVETYLEEAEELLEQAEKVLEHWKGDRGNRSLLLSLQRTYHTLKGNSRIVNQQEVGKIAYQLEVIFEQFAFHQFTSDRYDDLIIQSHQWLRTAIYDNEVAGLDKLHARLQKVVYDDSAVSVDETTTAEVIDFADYQESKVVQGDGSTPPEMYADSLVKQDQTAQEQIRVSADLVEKMIDLSGESAINRSRIELDLGQMTNTLSEMELAILRLADQLRRMDGELESQIIAKHEVEGQRYADFDPLEMDQYSSLNQLSKSLAESASDLIDFKTTLADKIRDTESLLLQQSRLQNELQQNLMGTRLVPFTRLVPRLQRLVRQVSTQLNRPVDFNIENTEGELDRNILERLVSPLEHMLRNAIDHGIEDQEQRAQAGKSATGRINLNIAREGNDILVIFSDDGKGIDVDAVKAKATNNGLITADMQVSDEDVMQYIFHPGLSTAQKVTQISGRGVGLDVVQNEIKSLGGHVSVKSTLGQGTEFTIRVPTSVAVSDALMVRVGDQQFALPLAQIERIVRISPVALSEYYDSKKETFELDRQQIRLRYVGEFVTGQAKPMFSNMGSSVPVIIFNSSGRSVALQVDQLVGSRAQVVIKPIGQQLSSVGYVGGATILANGKVSLILDGQTIARRVLTTARAHQVEKATSSSTQRTARKTVMVVDDSVTVRKVTTRLLERHGYEVITANDGVDAIEKLAQGVPDLMLLDIEMPRMDGFEVATYVRHDSNFKALPIIMITSRTGEKHREHAFSLGVNEYMGKPFQEADLVSNIQKVLAKTKANAKS
ncbi:Hpt domain-containing protein [Acinetobacter sp. A3.8]|uniref:Chemotaxis protein CheA n=1 Tax=Acinetobacter sedimenti TaxID=2919922 RepID=A0A9X2BA58_9GAMM|nr:Hpt domain-containing protein [Acinetobacter sedimenti]MCJ8146275.1 Hpt domain-containing protein [Acinetobacter sedimenti]